MIKAFVSSFRLGVLTFFILIGFGVLTVRLYHLHILEHDRLAEIVENNRNRSEVIHSRRGNIVDVQGNLLATSHSSIEVGVDPEFLDTDDKSKFPELASLLDIPLEKLELAFQPTIQSGRPVRWRKLADGVDELVYEKILALNIRGIYGNRTFDRVYPGETLAAHVLGFVNKEDTAVMGIERAMDFYLRGQNGWRESERDGRLREIAHFRSREVAATDGLDVELSLDQMIQNIIEQELQVLAEMYRPKSATIIVSEPATGYLLGLANYPTFNPNNFWEFDIASHRNRAVTDTFEPGSTFKIIPASAALNESLVTPDDQFDCSLNKLSYGERVVRLPKDIHDFGLLSVREIVSQSSNRGAAQLGMLLGSKRLYNYSRDFGFGAPTGYEASGEVGGVLHPINNWDGLTITRLPIGHAVSATPLQVHYAMSVVANRGILMQPQFVRRVFDRDTGTVLNFKPVPRRRVLSNRTAQIMAQMLRRVVDPEGTAQRADIPGFQVAGKTGTTQKIIEGSYSNDHHVASFVGFLPANRPQVVITVIVDDPKSDGVGYGGQIAAPFFRNVAEQIIKYKGIQPIDETENTLVWEGSDFDWLR